MNLVGEEDSGPQFFSPGRIQRARDLQEEKEAQERANRERIAAKKVQAAVNKAQNEAAKAERALQAKARRQLATEEKLRKAEERAEKQAARQALQAEKEAKLEAKKASKQAQSLEYLLQLLHPQKSIPLLRFRVVQRGGSLWVQVTGPEPGQLFHQHILSNCLKNLICFSCIYILIDY